MILFFLKLNLFIQVLALINNNISILEYSNMLICAILPYPTNKVNTYEWVLTSLTRRVIMVPGGAENLGCYSNYTMCLRTSQAISCTKCAENADSPLYHIISNLNLIYLFVGIDSAVWACYNVISLRDKLIRVPCLAAQSAFCA